MPDVDQNQSQSTLWIRQPYLSYLLRLWQEQVNGHPHWRASVECIQTGEQHSFASWEQVVDFLAQEQRKEETINRTV